MTAQQRSFNPENLADTGNCPFFDSTRAVCRAAQLAFVPDGKHLYAYCCSDDHDDCALFLAKALRSSSPGGHARDAAAYCEK
jgi:hypothetical protein